MLLVLAVLLLFGLALVAYCRRLYLMERRLARRLQETSDSYRSAAFHRDDEIERNRQRAEFWRRVQRRLE